MFREIADVTAMPDLKLRIDFAEGVTKVYDVAPLLERFSAFKVLEDDALFAQVKVDMGGHGVVWNDDVDLSCDELWEHGTGPYESNVTA